MTFLTADQAIRAGRLLLSIAPRRKRSDNDRAATRRWEKAHPEKTREYKKRYKLKMKEFPRRPLPDKQKEYKKQWQKLNRDKTAAYHRKWVAKKGRQHLRDYEKKKRTEDVGFRIAGSLRLRVRKALRSSSKIAGTMRLLGCTIDSFRIYLESLFQEGMTWGNYGSFWEIDHIIPCAIFDMSNPDHQKRCFHFSNQQPLTVTANRRKHTKTTEVIC